MERKLKKIHNNKNENKSSERSETRTLALNNNYRRERMFKITNLKQQTTSLRHKSTIHLNRATKKYDKESGKVNE